MSFLALQRNYVSRTLEFEDQRGGCARSEWIRCQLPKEQRRYSHIPKLNILDWRTVPHHEIYDPIWLSGGLSVNGISVPSCWVEIEEISAESTKKCALRSMNKHNAGTSTALRLHDGALHVAQNAPIRMALENLLKPALS